LDAARADHFGCYGYPGPTSPNIDRLAKDSLVFEQHYCQYSLTEDSTQALFESRYCVPKKSPSDSPSLVAALQPLGFNTLLFTANPWVLFAAPSGKGFNHVEVELPKLPALRMPQPAQTQKASAGPDNLLAKISRWLAKKPKQPFFTYIHFLPPHIPYDAPKNITDIFLGKKPPAYWKAPSAMLAEETGKAAKWLAAHRIVGPDIVLPALETHAGGSIASMAAAERRGAWQARGGVLSPLLAGARFSDEAGNIGSAGLFLTMKSTSCPRLSRQ
jgi:hypothetical protein